MDGFFFLCVISIIEVFSASSGLTYKSGSYLAPVFKHMFLLSLGAIAMIFTLNIPCRYFKTPTLILYFGSILGLLWAVIAGEATNNAQRWISFFRNTISAFRDCKGNYYIANCANF